MHKIKSYKKLMENLPDILEKIGPATTHEIIDYLRENRIISKRMNPTSQKIASLLKILKRKGDIIEMELTYRNKILKYYDANGKTNITHMPITIEAVKFMSNTLKLAEKELIKHRRNKLAAEVGLVRDLIDMRLEAYKKVERWMQKN